MIPELQSVHQKAAASSPLNHTIWKVEKCIKPAANSSRNSPLNIWSLKIFYIFFSFFLFLIYNFKNITKRIKRFLLSFWKIQQQLPIKTIVVLFFENRSFEHMIEWTKKSINPSINGVTARGCNHVPTNSTATPRLNLPNSFNVCRDFFLINLHTFQKLFWANLYR